MVATLVCINTFRREATFLNKFAFLPSTLYWASSSSCMHSGDSVYDSHPHSALDGFLSDQRAPFGFESTRLW